jgi:hypothetical protein
MTPSGPGRSDNCRPVGTFAPPPFPIQVINVTSIETVRDTRVIEDGNDELQDVTFSVSVHWEEPEVQYRGDIEYEIYLGQRALEPDEETKKNIDTDNNDDGLQTHTVERIFRIPLEQSTVNAFLQVLCYASHVCCIWIGFILSFLSDAFSPV